MSTSIVDRQQLRVTGAAARAAAQATRRDSLTTSWRAAGTRLASRDLRVEVAWTVFQHRRFRGGEQMTLTPIRRCRQRNCRLPHCGRPPSYGG